MSKPPAKVGNKNVIPRLALYSPLPASAVDGGCLLVTDYVLVSCHTGLVRGQLMGEEWIQWWEGCWLRGLRACAAVCRHHV